MRFPAWRPLLLYLKRKPVDDLCVPCAQLDVSNTQSRGSTRCAASGSDDVWRDYPFGAADDRTLCRSHCKPVLAASSQGASNGVVIERDASVDRCFTLAGKR